MHDYEHTHEHDHSHGEPGGPGSPTVDHQPGAAGTAAGGGRAGIKKRRAWRERGARVIG